MNPKKPLAIVRQEGNRGHQKLPKPEEEVHVDAVSPDCPAWLTGEARKEWIRVVPLLLEAGLLGRVDQSALAGYCQSWARYQEAEKLISKKGMLLKTPQGYAYPNPAVGIANKTLDKVKAFCMEFGMSPSARARMSIPGRKAPDGFDEFIGKKQA